MRILLVEDDIELARRIQEVLSINAYETTICITYKQALNEINKPYDCYLLDVRLPDGNGLELCNEIRCNCNNPVIFISSDTSEESILISYKTNGDDYIVKPFRLKVLLAKVEYCLKKTGNINNEIIIDNFVLKKNTHTLFCPDMQIDLSPTEYTIIEQLFRSYPNPVSREKMYIALFSSTGKNISDATLNVRVSELKKKLGSYSYKIKSKRYVGYKWLED